MKIFHVCCSPSIPLGVNVKIDEFDEDEEGENWPFREPVGGLMLLVTATPPDISNAVRSVAGSCSAPKAVHWKARSVFLHT